jgi:hypothetical protein
LGYDERVSKELVQQLAPVLWDVDPATVDPERHAGFLVQRVLERGRMKDWKLLCELYGLERIEAVAAELPQLEPKAHAFCAAVFNRPRESFRCYTSRRSPHGRWPF